MSFACQRDSYQRELDSKVMKCQPSKLNGSACYEVICEDTILFPEGGGQVSSLTAIRSVTVYMEIFKGCKICRFQFLIL